MLNFMIHRISTKPHISHVGRVQFAPRRYRAVLALFLGAVLLGACDLLARSPEAQARDFIRGLIIQSDESQQPTGPGVAFAGGLADARLRLGDSAVNESHLDDLETRVTIEYLRAKHAQGVELSFGYAGVHHHTDTGQIVTIVVMEPKAVASGSSGRKTFRFRVRLHEAEGEWQVASVTTRA